ncbi:hypothetical protein A2767_06380 [Candidatus Roizmanbacteria bacterium RIFCSPHIGHO2_01_FULL_35_10]|uniref:Uncharacterized protein n=1 Tax=Candidatus Roizmanbacteria bacterium RIFCSPLOWO2_01_FULL_35_13 TaxID=1802055 RepID=A0A1F7ID50_9BACT|nr:MAG: hypothetical protein A2767_06380 [Candidatus Roizmanbacteria bacterium RIFCSPHIGHO2_01_FULL_35_10]OGK41289.1 MAG: hypothetical protein A3A74_00295 [Candidatus Roizmanbacteria bacterium RIFCSPLOWO2_01_FULL_35_13]
MSPDLKQNIFYTVFFIFLHNFSAIFYFTGIVISAILLLIKPTRWKALLLFGFIILLFAFEYKKHIVEPLKQQTLNSLITVRQHYKTERVVNIFLTKALPLLLPLSGWSLVVMGFLMMFRGKKKK